jgi:hypothetical protein
MKKVLLFVLLGAGIASNVFATKLVVVNRTKLNGDGSGNYRDVSRHSESGTNAAGQETEVISIGCAEPGPNGCPKGKSIGLPGDNGDPMGSTNPSVMAYIENRMGEIDVQIDHGISVGSDIRLVAIQQVDGKYIQYRVSEKWNCTTKAGTITITVEEIGSDVVPAAN